MKRWSWGASALGTLSVAVTMAVAAQEPRQDQAPEPHATDQPQMKCMMMRGRPMQGMMPMTMEMHRQHVAMESQWEATDAGIFVLRHGQLLKYDGDLKLVKTVDLPKMSSPMMPHHGDEADEAGARPKMQGGMGAMRQMMVRMHEALPTKLAVTPDAVYVSRGSRLLKFSHDLELQKSVDLPETTPMACPMCEQMMEQMVAVECRATGMSRPSSDAARRPGRPEGPGPPTPHGSPWQWPGPSVAWARARRPARGCSRGSVAAPLESHRPTPGPIGPSGIHQAMSAPDGSASRLLVAPEPWSSWCFCSTSSRASCTIVSQTSLQSFSTSGSSSR